MRKAYSRLFGYAAVVAVLDQLSKFVVVQNIELGRSIEVIPGFFNLVHVLNRGAAFGMLNRGDISWQRWFFVAVSLLALAVIFIMARMSRSEERFQHIGLGLIFGGALGNLVDRLHTGMVIDFLDVYLGAYHWPAFNVADSAITIGALLLIVSFYHQGHTPRHKGQTTREQD